MSQKEEFVELFPGVYVLNGVPALYLERYNYIVLADLHFGFEEAMSRQGVFLPRLQLKKIQKIIIKIRNILDARRLIVNGDIKHDFSRLLRSEKVETAKFLKTTFDAGFEEVIVVRGNHDNYIGPIIRNLGGEFVEELTLGNILITHGHKRLDKSDFEDIIIIGHEHPSISVSIGGLRAKFPALLVIPRTDGGFIIVLPAAGAYQTGNSVTLDRSSYLSPIVREVGVIEEMKPVIVDEKEGTIVLPKLSLLNTLL
jgi:putative SbcD/Mre11-related phosphoesterase